MNTRLNRKPVLLVAGAAAVLFLSANGLSLAQGAGGQGRANGSAANGGVAPGQIPNVTGAIMNSPMGAQMGEMLNKMRQSHAFVDPGIGQTSSLLTRSDVRNELVLNGRQTETIVGLQNGYPAAMMTGIMTTVMSSIQKMQQEGGNLDVRSMSPDERQQMFTQMRDTVTDSLTAVQADQNKKSEAILTPAQTKRLRELDLQWRGPLALSDEKLADKVSLTPDQRVKFTAMLKELRDTRMKAQTSMFSPGGGFPGLPGAGGNRPTGARGGTGARGTTGKSGAQPTDPNGAGNPAPNTPTDAAAPAPPGGFTPPTPEQIQQATDAAAKQSEAALKAADKKALLLLTPEQQAQWKLLQGKPFTFRQYL